MRALCALLAFLFLALPATAQDAGSPAAQREELDTLFARLRDKNVGAAAIRTEARIWDLWMRGGTDEQDVLLEDATAQMNSGNFKRSEEMLNRLIGTTKTFPEAYNKRATLYFLMGRFDDSLADIVTTLELEPRHFGALSGRGMIYQRLGRDVEAIQAYKEGLAINPHMLGAALAVRQLEKTAPEL